MSYLFNNKVGFIGNAVDAFNRLKVSQPFTLFDSQMRFADNGKFDTSTSGSAYASHDANSSSMDMNVFGISGDEVVRQSKRVFAYQPGKSLLVINSFVFASPDSGLRQRVGYFDANNGIFLEQDDNQISIVLRSSSSGSLVEQKISRSSWNSDPLDGFGKSKIDIDITKANLFWIDIEWLGVGNVRCGFFYDGEPFVAHVFKNINNLSTTYMTTACLPVRYEITNTGNNGNASSLKQICSTVVSEAGYESYSTKSYISRGATSASLQNLSSAGVFYPTVSLRLNSSRLSGIVVLSQADLIVDSNNSVEYKILLNPTLVGSSFTASSSGCVDYDISATGISGGTTLNGGFVSARSSISLGSGANWSFQLGKFINGTSDVITLACSPFSANNKVATALGWEEIL